MLSLTVPGKSWLHKLPVSGKLAALCLTTFVMLTVKQWEIALAGLGVIAALYASVSLDFARMGARRLRPLLFVILIIGAYQIWIERYEEGAVICLKIVSAVALANLVTMTSRLDAMIAVVEKLARPFQWIGLHPRTMGLSVGLVLRFTPVFLEKGRSLNEAWRARSFKRTNPRLLVPLALGALDDADRVADAIRARGGLNARPTTNGAKD